MLKKHTCIYSDSSRDLFNVYPGAVRASCPRWMEMGSPAGDAKALRRDLRRGTAIRREQKAPQQPLPCIPVTVPPLAWAFAF